ncbi:MAG: hypothetical protein N2203_01005 [Bacteroidia bacterium]|nr:hypothetical protein [Bacteroidia bacterium]
MTRCFYIHFIKRLLIAWFFIGSFTVLAQSKKQLYKAAVSSMENKDYENATYYYHLLLMQDSLNTDYQYQLATAARFNYQTNLSLYWYKKLLDNGADQYPDVLFYVGLLSKNKGDYKNAIRYFEKFSKKYKSEKKYPQYKPLVQEAKLHIIGCENALTQQGKFSDKKIFHPDTNINSPLSEYAPLMTDTALIYTKLIKTQDNNKTYAQLFSSTFHNDTFDKAKPLPAFINEVMTNISNYCPYKNIVFFTKCTPVNATEYECKIYYTKYINYHWTSAAPLSYEINHPHYTTTHPYAIKLNGKNYLFFSSNRPNGKGGMDIWYAAFDDALNFEKPVNISINSEYDEITPFFDNQNNELYFASNHPTGYGGFDIWVSSYSNISFLKPENLGRPINSSYNDLYFTLSVNKQLAFFSSNRPESYFEEFPNCCNDLYYLYTGITTSQPDTIKKILTQKDTILQTFNKLKLLVPLTLYFHNDEPDPKTKKTSTDKNYQKTCELYLNMKDEYIKEYSAGLKGEGKEKAIQLVERFFEDSVEYGFNQLEKFAGYLEELMKNKATVKIIMKGYCSPLASTEYNINLAKRRISSLRNYFYQYKNGWLMKYIKNENDTALGKIILEDLDIGELPTSKVSDNLKDKRNSVYSPYAAAERKIQILAVELKE